MVSRLTLFNSLFLKYSFIQVFFFFFAVLCCCTSCSLVAMIGSTLSLWCTGLLIAAASLGMEHRLQSAGSVIVTHGLSCSKACGIFPDQGSNPYLLHQQVDSSPLSHQGSPTYLSLHYTLGLCHTCEGINREPPERRDELTCFYSYLRTSRANGIPQEFIKILAA